MPDVTASAHVFPSANDLIGSQPTGWGRTSYEKNLAGNWLSPWWGTNFVLSGFTFPGSSANLTLTIPAGIAYLGGYYVSVGATNITFPASATSHVFLKLLRDVNGNVSSVAYEHNTSGTYPNESLELGQVVTNASAVIATRYTIANQAQGQTSTVHPYPVVLPRVHIFTSSGSWRCPAGVRLVRVTVFGAGGGGGGGGGGLGSCTGGNGASGAPGTLAGGYYAVVPGTDYSITIGAGGSGGSGGAPGSAGASGGTGGTTSFASLLSVGGGNGGAGGSGGSGGYSCANGFPGAFTIIPPAVSGAQWISAAGGSPGGAGGVGGSGGGGSGGTGGTGQSGRIMIEF